MVAQAWITSAGNLDSFQRDFARRLRWWLVGVPAGIGLATLRSILKLWIGVSPSKSGVFSAGNGPAMRSAVLGAMIDERAILTAAVTASTRITHSDPKADYGAQAVALAAWLSRQSDAVTGDHFLNELRSSLPEDAHCEFIPLIERAVQSASANESSRRFADELGCAHGVSGYVYHTVPIVIQTWLRHPRDFATAIPEIIGCGGDTDTTAAILGGIIGAGVGKVGIPAEWLNGLCEWPRTVAWMERLGATEKAPAPRLPILGVIGRNGMFILAVLGHVLRRGLPPY